MTSKNWQIFSVVASIILFLLGYLTDVPRIMILSVLSFITSIFGEKIINYINGRLSKNLFSNRIFSIICVILYVVFVLWLSTVLANLWKQMI